MTGIPTLKRGQKCVRWGPAEITVQIGQFPTRVGIWTTNTAVCTKDFKISTKLGKII